MLQGNRLKTLLALAAFVALPAFAQEAPVSTLSATQMIQNIAAQIPLLMQLATAVSYVLGMALIYVGLMKLKQYGQERSMMSGDKKMSGVVMSLAMGTLLLYLPSTVQMGLGTFWSDPSPYGYLANQDLWSQFINNVYLIIQLFGTIALIRGLVTLSHVGDRGHQEILTKGLMYVIGGIFCINIYGVVQLVLVTLGIQTS